MADSDRKYGANTDERNADGTFADGNGGKPKGARNRATMAIQNLLDAQSQEITQKAVDMALEGDTTALRLCLERVCPPRKDTPIEFALPDIATAHDAADAARSVLSAVSEGLITPQEGAAAMGLIEQFRRTLEVSELEARVSKLEAVK